MSIPVVQVPESQLQTADSEKFTSLTCPHCQGAHLVEFEPSEITDGVDLTCLATGKQWRVVVVEDLPQLPETD
jgi:hypothetical protein